MMHMLSEGDALFAVDASETLLVCSLGHGIAHTHPSGGNAGCRTCRVAVLWRARTIWCRRRGLHRH